MSSAHFTISVDVESRPSASRWLDRTWHVVALRPGRRTLPDWTLLSEDEAGFARYHAGTVPLTARSADTKLYKDNIEAREPSVFVVLRRGATPSGWRLLLATVDPSEAHAHVDVGDDLVEALPMPRPLHEWLAQFIAHHHVERKDWKRTREPAPKDPGARRTAEPEDETFLRRWSRQKRITATPADTAPATAPVPPPEAATATAPSGALPENLPPIESLTTRSDFAAYLQAEVPKALRLAALRKAWAVDPAITGHKPLVDYDWNFNAPGYHDPLPGDSPAKLIADLFKNLSKPEEPDPEEDNTRTHEVIAARPQPEGAATVPEAQAPPSDAGAPQASGEPDTPPAAQVAPSPRRRHGGAAPT